MTKLTNNQDIFNIQPNRFEEIALQQFNIQVKNNPVYREYLNLLKINPEHIAEIKSIPFLPIDFFKSHRVVSTDEMEKIIFTSSGTTGQQTSKHYVTDLEVYEESFSKGFEYFYENVADYCILALLPSYLERQGSSLIYMTESLIQKSGHRNSGFYLYNTAELHRKLLSLEKDKQKTILLGVTFALLDFADQYQMKLEHTIVMETGGMKGRRKELTRFEMHEFLTQKLGVKTIHSEYGMTELLSQAYSQGNGVFRTPPWMKIIVRDVYDPFTILKQEQSGAINVIDLANVNSCSFIETKDVGRLLKDGSFEVSGRMEASEIRGCNLLIS
jgi:phenylacetate-coenzyme A ligase PaaK-like adenylate-forming protein